jgi:hypothetical protein
VYSGVGLKEQPRSGGGKTNFEIVNKLIEDDRDFFNLTKKQERQIVAAGEKTLEAMGDNFLNGRISAEQMWRATFYSLMAEWCKICITNIKQQKGNGPIRPLSPAYAASKGFSSVGILTGQLISNLQPTAANIVFNK